MGETTGQAALDYAALSRAIGDNVAESLTLFDVIVVTNAADDLNAHFEKGHLPDARLVKTGPPGGPLEDRLALAAARAGKEIVTWCTLTDSGRRTARETAKTLDPILPDGKRVRHITATDPTDWQPLIDPFDKLVTGARLTVPSAPRPPAAGGMIDKDRWNTTPRAVAQTLLREHGTQILAVDVDPAEKPENQHPTAYALDEETGLWDASTKPWTRWCFALARRMRDELRRSGLEGRAYAAADASIRKLERPSAVKELRQAIWPAADDLRDAGEDLETLGLTRCKPENLDEKLQYMGTANGVIDLTTGKLLDPEAGRTALATLSTPVKYAPEARHPDIDRLLGHLPEDEQEWWWSVLGHVMHGSPSGRVYLVKGPPDGGKSTLAQALRLTLGPYASTPAFGAIEERRHHNETELSPGIHAFTAPRRIALIDEVKTRRINNRLVKDLSGGGSVTYRLLNQNLQTRLATATMLLFCNDGSEPRLHLEDQGMQKRYRELPYPAIPKDQIDATFISERIKSKDFQQALLARLVARAVETRTSPPNIPSVDRATAERIREDIGELGEFARRIRPGGDDVLTGDIVWAAWCEYVDEPATEQESGGIHKRGIARALRSRVNGLPAPKLYSVSGKKVRGWRGWHLLSVEEAERMEGIRPLKERVEKAIDVLMAKGADLPGEEDERVRQHLRAAFVHPKQLETVAQVYGPDMEGALNGVFPLRREPDGKEFPVLSDWWWRSRSADGELARALRDVDGINLLYLGAMIAIEAERSESGALREVASRFRNRKSFLPTVDSGIYYYLTLAAQELGANALVEELASKAIGLMHVDAEGPYASQKEQEIVDLWTATAEAEINELCGLVDGEAGVSAAPGIDANSP